MNKYCIFILGLVMLYVLIYRNYSNFTATINSKNNNLLEESKYINNSNLLEESKNINNSTNKNQSTANLTLVVQPRKNIIPKYRPTLNKRGEIYYKKTEIKNFLDLLNPFEKIKKLNDPNYINKTDCILTNCLINP